MEASVYNIKNKDSLRPFVQGCNIPAIVEDPCQFQLAFRSFCTAVCEPQKATALQPVVNVGELSSLL